MAMSYCRARRYEDLNLQPQLDPAGAHWGPMKAAFGALLLLALGACAAVTPAADPPLLALDWSGGPAEVAERCETAIRTAESELAAALDSDGPAAARLVQAEQAIASLQEAAASPAVVAIAEVPAETQDAGRACADRIASRVAELGADTGVVRLAIEVERSSADGLELALAGHYRALGREAGLELGPAERERLVSALRRMRSLEDAYRQAAFSSTGTISISDAEAEALDPALLAAYERVEGGYRVPVNFSSASRRFLEEMPSSEARRRYWLAFMRRGGRQNVERLAEALELRREIAGLLGYPSWAHYRMEGRLAGSPEAVSELMDSLVDRMRPVADAQIQTLATRKGETGDTTPFAPWDYDYFRSRVDNGAGDSDEVPTWAFFPLDHTVPSTLDVVGAAVGVRFEHRTETPVWASGVQHWLIRDVEDDRLLAELYLDLEPRASKGLRPGTGTFRQGRRGPDGNWLHPVVTIIGNGPPGTEESPPSFGHGDLVEFFHEVGHVVQMALSEAPWAALQSGSVAWDFTEAPSQMFENWAWHPAVIARVSRHPETGEPLPAARLEKLFRAKNSDGPLFWSRQSGMVRWDLDAHSATPPSDPEAAWRAAWARSTPLPVSPETLPTAAFVPAMVGYDSGYYGYVWSRLYAQDLFTAFEEVEGALLGPEVGTRFRKEIIAPGATRPVEESVAAFLGRAVRPDAFYREIGLTVQ